jgi:hypothetical protein
MANAQSDRFSSARSAELTEDGCDMEFDSMLGYRQSRRNLFIGEPTCEHLQNFAFTGCQRFRKFGECAKGRPSCGEIRIYVAAMHHDKSGYCGLHSCNELLCRYSGWQDRPDARSHGLSKKSACGMVCEEDNGSSRSEFQLVDGSKYRFELFARYIYHDYVCFSLVKVVCQ